MYYELEPAQNTFLTIVADVTHRCNMACSNCYIPNRHIPDMDINKLADFLKALPNRVELRIVGAEPTVREDLPEIISLVRSLGHRPVLLTNGLKISKYSYLKTLFDAGLRTIYISMNGVDNDDWYQKTDGMKCAAKKVMALENAASLNMYMALGCIQQRGANEGSVARLFNLIKEKKVKTSILRFRNVGQIGRFSQSASEAHSFDDLKVLVANGLNIDLEYIEKNSFCGLNDRKSIFFHVHNEFARDHKTLISLTNWNNRSPDPHPAEIERRRGRITPTFKVAPYFEHILANENQY